MVETKCLTYFVVPNFVQSSLSHSTFLMCIISNTKCSFSSGSNIKVLNESTCVQVGLLKKLLYIKDLHGNDFTLC